MKLGQSTFMKKHRQKEEGELNLYPFTVPKDAKFL
jgi:hypothetical protein